MATLHVRDVPDELYERIRKLAQAKNRSLSAQVNTLLARAVADEEHRQSQAELLAEARRLRESIKWDPSFPDSTTLLREDRDR
jgi:plasmid stability protein